MKQIYQKLLFTTLLITPIVTQTAFASSFVIADEDLKITAINGQEVNQGLFQRPTQSFELPAGQTVISARYERLFDLTRNDHDIVKSEEITLVAELTDGQTYHLTTPKLPKTHAQATEFAKAPTFTLTHNNQVIASESKTQSKQSLFGGLFGKKTGVSENQRITASLPKTKETSTPNIPKNDNTLDAFMRLWLNANEAEREKIRQWVNQ